MAHRWIGSWALVALVVGAWAVGCQPGATPPGDDGGAEPRDLATPVAPRDLAGTGPCAPALAITPGTPVVNPFGLVTLGGSGGTGAYRFRLAASPSGGIINALTGAYLGGAKADTTDVVEMTDQGCVGKVEVSVRVVPHIEVRPSSATVPPATSFKIDVRGGSGTFTFELLQGGSGGTLQPTGEYAAGTRVGLDAIRVADVATGDTTIADINVDPAATLAPDPSLVMVPAGATFRLRLRGGSGWFDAAVTGDAATFQDGIVTGVKPGSARLDLTDTFTRQTARVAVTVSTAQTVAANRAGDQFSHGTIVAAQRPTGAWQATDLDGDGLADAIVANPEADVAAYNSGAVYLYRGAAGGPAAMPTRVIAGEGREDELGRGAAAGDFDGDGRLDLAIGAPRADVGATDAGAVYIYKGVGNGLLSAEPAQVLAGESASDLFGYTLTAGDFNGDGRLDLAVAAILDEDAQAMPRANDQGAVNVFLGYPDGFLTRPDAIVYGQAPDVRGAWAGRAGLQLGRSLGAGDIDGDARCDLAAGSMQFNSTLASATPDTARSDDGALFVYAGLGPNGSSLGGVRATPSRFYAGGDADGRTQFGRHVVAGDLDGDGKAELVVGQAWADVVAAGRTLGNAGAVRVWKGGALPGNPPSTFVNASAADASYLGTTANNFLGFQVAIGDAGGDGLPDLVVGHWIDDAGVADGGSVRVWAGRAGQLPDPAAAARTVGGVQVGERLGQALAVVGDMDGDRKNDIVALAGLSDVGEGTDVGVPYFIAAGDAAVPKPLDMPGQPSGAWAGYSHALVDLNNDGFTDLAVGAPLADPVLPTTPQSGINAGLVHVYFGTASGIPAQPSLTLTKFLGHSAGDQLGYRLAAAGDFDGDGLQDLAVLARTEDLSAPLRDVRYDATACAAETTRNDAGAIYVFRGSRGAPPATEPAFVVFGPQPSFRIDSLAAGLDVNGDGKTDLVYGGFDWRGTGNVRTGGVAVVAGRAATAGKTRVICDPLLVGYGNELNGLLGIAVTAVGRVDADACADFAVGARDEALTGADNLPTQGTVRIVFGWGGTGCPARPRVTLLRSRDRAARAGASLAAADLDGDGIPELGVGGWNHAVAGISPGGAWVVPGAYLRGLAAGAVAVPASGDLPAPPVAALVPTGATGRFLVEGSLQGELLGQDVAMLPNIGRGRGALAVGAPLGAVGGAAQTGGVRVFEYRSATEGLDGNPVAAFGGETARAGARVGETLSTGTVAGTPALVVGAYLSSAVSLDYGTAYVLPLRLP